MHSGFCSFSDPRWCAIAVAALLSGGSGIGSLQAQGFDDDEGWQEVPRGVSTDVERELMLNDVQVQPTSTSDVLPKRSDSSERWQSIDSSSSTVNPESAIDNSFDSPMRPAAEGWKAIPDSAAIQDESNDRAIRALEAQRTREPVKVEPDIQEFGPEGSAAQGLSGDDTSKDGSGVSAGGLITLDDQNVDMFAGEVQVFGEVDVTRVAVGNGGIVRAEVINTGELLVIAQAAGSSSLRLWNKDGSQSSFNVRVSETDPVTRVRMERMVRMRVRLVEFRKSALSQLGINWVDQTAGPTLGAAGDAVGNSLFRPPAGASGIEGLPNRVAPFSTYFGIASNITSNINFLATNGDAVLLAEPVLSAVNGGSASFLAGGEVPYPVTDANGQRTVDFKEYGVKLDISPVIDNAGNVRTQVGTEVSQLDQSVSIDNAPGLLTRRAQTEVNVRSGETIVISGLLNAESGKDIDRIPGLGRLPVIGRLFRSDNTRNSVSELVIFVTPELVEPTDNRMAEREQQLLDESSARIEQARDQLPLME